MSRHTFQIKTLLENKRLSKSRFNPESSFRAFNSPLVLTPSLKRSDSTQSLRKKSNDEIHLIEDRYRKLEQNYRAMLEETKEKAVLFAKQKSDLEKCKIQSEKDKKQIQRLRSMLGFTKKEDFGIQVNLNAESRFTYNSDTIKTSNYSKDKQETDGGMRKTVSTWNSKNSKKSTKKQSFTRTPYKLMKNKSETTIFYRSPLNQSNMKCGMEKYKFVPTISLN